MNNETTAGQPKSIGDDALGEFIDEYEWRTDEFCHKPTETERLMLLDFAVNLDDSRAPAAQAFATIQAAPDDLPSTMEDARKLIQYLRIEIDSKVMELYDIKKKLAATIQEPVMVADRWQEAVKEACIAACIDWTGDPQKTLSTLVEWHVEMAIDPAVSDHASMVADPAGVTPEIIQWRNIQKVVTAVADFCFGSKDDPVYGASHRAVTTCLTAKDGVQVTLEPLAATVKAVPSEALKLAAYRVTSPNTGKERLMKKSMAKVWDRSGYIVTPLYEIAAPLADKTEGAA